MNGFRNTLRFSIVGCFIAIFAIVIAGGGHGTVLPSVILFPWAFLTELFHKQINEAYALIAIFAQFPIYGLIYDLRRRYLTLAIICVVHILLAIPLSQLSST